MSKKVLVLSGSPRKGGNSDTLCDEFIKGAKKSGNEVKKVMVKDKDIHYCIGCNTCQNNAGKCVFKDDEAEIIEDMIWADSIVLGSPLYFYSMSAQLKTLIDRVYAKYSEIKNKDFYFILTGETRKKHKFETPIQGLRGFISCLPESKEKGIIYGIGAFEIGDIKDKPCMEEAYNLGRSIN